MAFTGKETHDISFIAAGEMTTRYRDSISPGERVGGYFSKDAMQSVLDQENCVGLKYYYGLDALGAKVLVVVGVDKNENDIVGVGKLCMEMSTPCPDQCGADNILNS